MVLWLAALGSCFVARLLFVDWLHLAAPYDTDYETPAYATTEVILRGLNPYAPEVYAEPPFVLTMYTPLYFGLAAALNALGGHPFFAGRLITVLSSLAIGVMMTLCARRRAMGALLVGAVSGMWFVIDNTAQYRPDMMGIALAFGGVLAARRPTPRRLAFAGVLLLLALAAKQNLVSAGAAVSVALLVRDRRVGVRFVAGLLAGGLAALAFFHAVFGPGVWTSTLGIPALGRFTWAHGLGNLTRAGGQPFVLAVLVLVGVVIGTGHRRAAAADGDDQLPLRHDPALWWAAIATVVQLVGVFREGGGPNYFIEPTLAWCCVAGRTLPDVRARLVQVALAVVALIGTSDLMLAPARTYSAVSLASDDARRKLSASLEATITQLAGPGAVVVHPQFSRHAVEVSREVVINDPWLYGEAWRSGLLPRQAFDDAIAAQRFDVIMLSTPRGPRAAHALDDETLRPLIAAHYQLVNQDGAFEYWLRAAPPDG